MPSLGFVPISPPQEGESAILHKMIQVTIHFPHFQNIELVLPPQHVWTFRGSRQDPGSPYGLGRDRRGQRSWDGITGMASVPVALYLLGKKLKLGCVDLVPSWTSFIPLKWQPRDCLPWELTWLLSLPPTKIKPKQPIPYFQGMHRLACSVSYKESIKHKDVSFSLCPTAQFSL